MSSLFTPAVAGAINLPNRIVMAPMTRSRAVENAAPNALHAEYYSQRASAGLIITEGVSQSGNGLGYARTPSIHTPEQVAAWRTVTDAVHANGGRIAHSANQSAGARVLAPSPIAAKGAMWTDATGMQTLPVPEELTIDEIHQTIEDYAQAARNARDADFDGAELHAANGYLPNQLLSPNTNQRTDEYGSGHGVEDFRTKRIRFLGDPDAAVTYPLLATELAKRNAAWLHICTAIHHVGRPSSQLS